jgi:hypothetical protein
MHINYSWLIFRQAMSTRGMAKDKKNTKIVHYYHLQDGAPQL